MCVEYYDNCTPNIKGIKTVHDLVGQPSYVAMSQISPVLEFLLNVLPLIVLWSLVVILLVFVKKIKITLVITYISVFLIKLKQGNNEY